MLKWSVESNRLVALVEATNQWEAFDALKEKPVEDFGLLTVATPWGKTTGDQIAVRTSVLFYRWNREGDALLAIRAAIREGLPNTASVDREIAKRSHEQEVV